MKGVAHFAIGLATASCFPEAVRLAAQGSALPIALGGVCGLLPDTLDFKFVRYFQRCDIHVAPDPLHPDMQMTAEAVAEAARRVMSTGTPCQIRLHTIRLGADRWQSYRLAFDHRRQCVAAWLGPIVDTGGNPQPSAATPSRVHKQSQAPLPVRVRFDYTATIAVDILEGPLLSIEADGTSGLVIRFIPWHRRWSHSLIFSLGLGLGGALLLGPLAGAIMATAHAAHALTDQAGWMGGSLFYPLIKKRLPGRGLWKSGNAQVNMAAVWLSILLIFWNLYMASDIHIPRFNPVGLLFWGALVPWLAAGGIARFLRQRQMAKSKAVPRRRTSSGTI